MKKENKMKRFLIPIAALTIGFAFSPSVKAIVPGDIATGQSGITCTNTDKEYQCELTGEAKLDIEVKDGETLILDLKGHKLTNFTNELAVILVEANGSLTVKDSSPEQSGEITTKEGSTGNPAIVDNKGNFNLEGGKLTTSRVGSAIIYNDTNGILNISGGEIETTGDGTTLTTSGWGITNKGKATITDGKFNQNGKVSLIQNEGDLTIDGGEFTSADDSYALITNSETGANPSLTITNGTFNTNNLISEASGTKNENTTISGGQFQNTENLEEYLDTNLQFDSKGNVVKKPSSSSSTNKKEDNKDEEDTEKDKTDSPIIAPETSATETSKPTEDVPNPTTNDNMYVYINMLVISVLGAGISLKHNFMSK